ncbi:LLM class flavin-dependent oxidoreductase [Microbacterium marinilacus]|uniref:LLM class flavin-dependent oxidoreductase n=1 Tax=Microbacterium marinilacus TaxID=415209 RepID=A0ABP7BB60_9MICO|nr:LLM class flavin-dependent oxidoreductase [Microbacterium marinilacus]MBY0690227.1 LLM class flavin-dependent oxidoreductase [Microbacterium marinilacus]
MTIEILGMVSTSYGSESVGAPSGPVIDEPYLTEFARAHDRAGFDRILVAHSSSSPDAFGVAQHVLNRTERAGVLIAHRPGFVAPTQVARRLATLDHLTGGGRVAIHHITGGSDADQARDGDFVEKDARYRRTGEFIQILRRTLTGDAPFDFDGEFYRVRDAFSAVGPATDSGIPIFFGGLSDAAVETGAEHTDVYALWGEPLAATKERIDRIQAAAAAHGRQVEFSVSLRPIVGATEDEAWQRADEHYQAAKERIENGTGDNRSWRIHRGERNQAVGRQLLHAHALENDVHDERLWFGINRLTGAAGNSTGPVGTAEQVVESLLKYYDLGVRKFLIRGYDPLRDVQEWGDELVPLLRERAAQRESVAAVA